MALIRYPGSKSKLATQIIRRFPLEMKSTLWSNTFKWEYREPFFGAGAVGFDILRYLDHRCSVWLNDVDRGVACLWKAVQSQHTQLLRKIYKFEPTADAFYEFKNSDGQAFDELECGFRKLALHQMSVSGFGAKSGGPLGGRNQSNAAYPVDCRWNAERLCSHVSSLHETLAMFDNIRITNEDFSGLLVDPPETCFIYLDPPYVEKGGQLYKHNLTHDDHRRLAALVHRLPCPWALSYDDHELVRELYWQSTIEELVTTYTNATNAKARRPKNREVVITPAKAEAPA